MLAPQHELYIIMLLLSYNLLINTHTLLPPSFSVQHHGYPRTSIPRLCFPLLHFPFFASCGVHILSKAVDQELLTHLREHNSTIGSFYYLVDLFKHMQEHLLLSAYLHAKGSSTLATTRRIGTRHYHHLQTPPPPL